MSNKAEKNIWQHKRIAPLEYCSISRAAQILDCEETDIFHWCYTRKIRLCIHFQSAHFFYTPFIREYGPIINQVEDFNSMILPEGDGIPYVFSDKFKSGYFFIPEQFHLVETKEHYLVQTHVSGLWPVDSETISPYFQIENDTTDICLLTEANSEFKPENPAYQLISPSLLSKGFPDQVINNAEGDREYIEYLSNYAPDINHKNYNLQIAGYSIEYIYKHAVSGNYMPTIIFDDETKPLAKFKNNEAPPPRTTAKQSSYIAALMIALGISEETMRFGSISKIREQLSIHAGGESYLPEITDDTLDDWLKRAGKR